jgi:uncharacterized membrane protein YphA (DoxX/SURF4 family)
MDVVLLIGRILFAAIFIVGGIGHLANRKAMAGYAQSMGIPAAEPATVVSGLMILAGGVMVAAGIWGDLGAILLLAFLVPTTLLMHRFWKIDDPQMQQMDQVMFFKNVSLIGGAIVLFWAFNQLDLPLTVTNSLISKL